MKKALYLSLLFTFLFTASADAQNYSSAVGLRLGSPWAASYKTFINESNALEFTGAFRSNSGYSWFGITGAYQIHKPISDVEGLNYYYGGGAGVYFYSFDSDFVGDGKTSIGIQGYLGLDYTFKDTPINITADWIPTFFLNGFDSGFGAGFGSVGVRYILGR